MNSIEQGTIVYIDFEPSKGSEIRKRRPAVVISRDEYSLSSNLIIVCPVTSTDKNRPYFVSIDNEALKSGSKVNAKQIYTLDFTKRGGRNVEILGKVSTREFTNIAQHVLMNFNFPI
ncbi:type II toxin-antitoxin system PemK/MazF family toxin [Enterococcus hulanensis]|uniref:type II toxin-antitoxin system PemK/MazF family toxin n=1 Tax=Enterococcus hulanensis TaxID=2559929 RepID=UPI0010F6B4B0|nr:type II toxin-antitoxin system PemK/MazF family toxin [Enterococcus hulanensis]